MFRAWTSLLSPMVDVWPVQLPGRGPRIAEPPYTRLRPLIRTIAEVLRPQLRRPYSIFGHSMGALLGYELAVQLRRDGLPPPAHLIVSGHRAPHVRPRLAPIHHLDTPAFLDEVRRLDGLPAEVFADAELTRLVTPSLRADFEVCETYQHEPTEPLDCDVLALGGIDDPLVGTDDLAAWRSHTRRTLTVRLVPGNHFFLESARDEVIHLVADAIRPGSRASDGARA
jgi:medium-chain acyl-[acyl-carrier-protein] hydrolase